MRQGKLKNLDDSAAIDEIANGTMLKQIAARYGVSKVAVYKRLRNHPDYKAAVASQAHSFVEDAMEAVFNADEDTVNIARARVDAAFKYAKAHNPDYADRPTVNVGISADQLVTIDASSLLQFVRASQQNAQLLEKEAKDVQVIDN